MSNLGGAVPGNYDKKVDELTVADINHDSRGSSDSTVNVEKGDVLDHDYDPLALLSNEDPFPMDEATEKETQQFTFRAVFVGCCLGGVIAAAK